MEANEGRRKGKKRREGIKRRREGTSTDDSPLAVDGRLCREIERDGEDVDVGELVCELAREVFEIGPV
jgi:hypothetical protein